MCAEKDTKIITEAEPEWVTRTYGVKLAKREVGACSDGRPLCGQALSLQE